MSPSPEQLARIHDALTAGQVITAIKIYREATGLGLAEAKAAVDAMIATGSRAPTQDVQPPGIVELPAGNLPATIPVHLRLFLMLATMLTAGLAGGMIWARCQDCTADYQRYFDAFGVSLLTLTTLAAAIQAHHPQRRVLSYVTTFSAMVMLVMVVMRALKSV